MLPKGIWTLKREAEFAVAGNDIVFFLVLGLVFIPDYPFRKQQREFNSLSLLTSPEVIHLLAQVQDECNKAAVMSLFNTTINKLVSLEEFEEIQTQTFTQVSRGGVREEHMEQPAVLSVCIRQIQQLQIDFLETDELSKETSCLCYRSTFACACQIYWDIM